MKYVDQKDTFNIKIVLFVSGWTLGSKVKGSKCKVQLCRFATQSYGEGRSSSLRGDKSRNKSESAGWTNDKRDDINVF